jgi:hypothetical protein
MPQVNYDSPRSYTEKIINNSSSEGGWGVKAKQCPTTQKAISVSLALGFLGGDIGLAPNILECKEQLQQISS